MIKINYKLFTNLIFWFLLLITSSCSYNYNSNKFTQEYEFNKLKLVRNNNKGKIAWSLNSPEARYDQDKGLIRAQKTTIEIYSNNKPAYNITADSLTSFNDLNFILLEGNIDLNQLNGETINVKGDALKWDVKKELMTIEQNAAIYSSNSSIIPESIIFNLKSNQLFLSGKTQTIIIPDNPSIPTDGKILLYGSNMKWNITTGELTSNDRIWGSRIGNIEGDRYSFKGESIKGNTRTRLLNLFECEIIQAQTFTTESEKCQLKLYVNDKIVTKGITTNIDNNDNNDNENIEFISILEKVKTKLVINKLGKALNIID